MGRAWREHQLNVYAEEFLDVGFYFDFKQAALEELAGANVKRFSHAVAGCPGQRVVSAKKPKAVEESNVQRLDPCLLGRHFNAYWQVCRKLGCARRPKAKGQMEMLPEEP